MSSSSNRVISTAGVHVLVTEPGGPLDDAHDCARAFGSVQWGVEQLSAAAVELVPSGSGTAGRFACPGVGASIGRASGRAPDRVTSAFVDARAIVGCRECVPTPGNPKPSSAASVRAWFGLARSRAGPGAEPLFWGSLAVDARGELTPWVFEMARAAECGIVEHTRGIDVALGVGALSRVFRSSHARVASEMRPYALRRWGVEIGPDGPLRDAHDRARAFGSVRWGVEQFPAACVEVGSRGSAPASQCAASEVLVVSTPRRCRFSPVPGARLSTTRCK